MHALIVCGGTPPSKKLLEQHVSISNYVVGADSGAFAIVGHGFTPDLVIGDLDSFHYTKHVGINVLKIEEQETNDLEKAINHVLEKGAKSCVILGGFGKRIDHTFTNLSVLKKYHPLFESICFVDDYGDTLLIESPYKTQLPVGTPISFFPLSGKVAGITTTGVEYPLENGVLETGVRMGTSNKTSDQEVTVYFEEGELAMFIGIGQKLIGE